MSGSRRYTRILGEGKASGARWRGLLNLTAQMPLSGLGATEYIWNINMLCAPAPALIFAMPIIANCLAARDRHSAPALDIQILRSRRSIESTVVTARDSKGRPKLVLPLIMRNRARVRMTEARQYMGGDDYSAPIVDVDL